MRILKPLLWIAFFAVATFFWVVVFEHGLGGIGKGLKAELRGLLGLFGSG